MALQAQGTSSSTMIGLENTYTSMASLQETEGQIKTSAVTQGSLLLSSQNAVQPPQDTNNVEVSHVFWRTETSLSEEDDNDNDSQQQQQQQQQLLEDTSLSSSSSSPLSSPNRREFVVDATSVKAQELRQRYPRLLEFPVASQKSYTVVLPPLSAKSDTTSASTRKAEIFVDVNLEQYMKTREMTPLQERMNALTMIPAPLYCIAFVLSGKWMSQHLVLDHYHHAHEYYSKNDTNSMLRNNNNENTVCMDWSLWTDDATTTNYLTLTSTLAWLVQHLDAIPPLPVLFVALGCVSHAPFSFLYHWKYAHMLTPKQRTDHWSRRLDQAMIHVSSTLTSYATSGSWIYFFCNLIFNAHSIVLQFQNPVRPHRNQARLGLSMMAWTLPILVTQGDWDLFLRVTLVISFGSYLFIKYPIGGWSHAAFHVFLVPLMPLLMEAAVNLPVSQEYLQAAAPCFVAAAKK